MILKGHGSANAAEIARELLRETDGLRSHSEHIAVLEARIEDYERRYELSSSMIHQAIDSGDLEESAEVCDWIMDVELLERARIQATRR